MQQFFEWVLPKYGFRLARKSICVGNATTILSILKLSIIYQFVRGMPVLYVETRLRKELEDIKAKEKQMEEEQLQMEKAKLALQREELMLRLQMQEFSQRKKSVEDHKISIMRKLGQKLS